MTDKMREEFEAAIAIETGMPADNFRDDRDGDSYASVGPKYSWWAWQKSRESLVIELPCASHYDGHQPVLAIEDCREAIEAAGVKVKP